MQQKFLKDEVHGPHGNSRHHVSSCFTGPLSHHAFLTNMRAAEIREQVGTSFGRHPEFGNSAVQGASRIAISEILGTKVDNVALTINTNHGLHTIKQGMGLSRSDQVVLYGAEYLDVKTPFVRREDLLGGCTPIFIKGERDLHERPIGFDLKEFETAIRGNKVSLVVVTHVQFTSGFTTDLAALSAICKENGVPLVVDAAQSFGALQIKPDELGLSAVVAPLWKWIGGYRGNAFLWTSPEFRKTLDVACLSASGLDAHDWLADVATAPLLPDSRRFESSTLPTEAWIPTKEMLAEAEQQGVKNIEAEIRRLQSLARDILSGNERLGIFKPAGSDGPSLGSFLAVHLKGGYAGREVEVVDRLWALQPKPIDITARGGFIRLAFHKFSSDETVKTVCIKLLAAVNEL